MLSMSRKKVFLLVVSLALMMSLFPNIASAAEGDASGLGSAFDTIRQLFAFLPELITMEKLLGEDAAAIFWAKFLVWLLLFAAIYFGASFPFKQNPRIAVIVALVISLMGTLLIPNSILFNIFQTYGLVAGIIIWTIPVAAGMFIAHKVENRFLRSLIYGTAAWILFSINETVVKEKGFANTSFPYFGLLLAVVILLFFWNLFAIFGGGQGQAAAGGWLGDRGRDAWDWATRDRSGDRGLLGGSRERREAIEGERRAQEQLESIQRLRQKLTETEALLQQHIEDPDIRQRFYNIALLLIQLREVQQALDAAENEIRGRI